jgi:hypothetical protein
VGYLADDFEIDKAAGVRRLKEITLLECSIVSMAMQPAALVTSAKAAPGGYESPNARRCREMLARIDQAVARIEASRPKSALQQHLARQTERAEDAARKAQLTAVRARLRAKGFAV